MVSIFLNLLRLVLYSIWSILENALMHLRRLCILLLLDEMCLYLSARTILPSVWFKSNVSLLLFCLDESGVLKSPTTIELSVSSFICFSIYMIVVSFWWIGPFIIIFWLSLSPAPVFGLKSILSHISSTSTFLWFSFSWNIFHSFILSLCKWVSCSHHSVGYYFFYPSSYSVPFNWQIQSINI